MIGMKATASVTSIWLAGFSLRRAVAMILRKQEELRRALRYFRHLGTHRSDARHAALRFCRSPLCRLATR
jgi:hypothetical protein